MAVGEILALCDMKVDAVKSAKTRGAEVAGRDVGSRGIPNLLNSQKTFSKRGGFRAWLTKMSWKRIFGNKYQGNVLSKMNLCDKMDLTLFGITEKSANAGRVLRASDKQCNLEITKVGMDECSHYVNGMDEEFGFVPNGKCPPAK